MSLAYRSVLSSIQGIDPDAQLFITATGITDSTQISAIDTLVKTFKNKNLWNKMKAIYPYVGGTATTHKFNLKDPRDLDVAFRLVFSGTVTHSSNGVQGNGTTGYADTKLIPSTSLINNDTHTSVYSRTDKAATMIDLGCNDTTGFSPRITMHIRWTGNVAFLDMNNSTNGRIQTLSIVGSSLGLSLMTRINDSLFRFYKNATLIQSSTTTNTSPLPNKSIHLMRTNAFDTNYFYSDRQIAFTTIGDGLDSNQSLDLYNAIQAFQTTLGRQV